jgi:hypothetical protein
MVAGRGVGAGSRTVRVHTHVGYCVREWQYTVTDGTVQRRKVTVLPGGRKVQSLAAAILLTQEAKIAFGPNRMDDADLQARLVLLRAELGGAVATASVAMPEGMLRPPQKPSRARPTECQRRRWRPCSRRCPGRVGTWLCQSFTPAKSSARLLGWHWLTPRAQPSWSPLWRTGSGGAPRPAAMASAGRSPPAARKLAGHLISGSSPSAAPATAHLFGSTVRTTESLR